ncbi:MAG: tRNA (adenosine(37)-N6)-threonylcarbamoyltransferase complex ATPase subunit type 1 TsaE [Leptospira sp.]|nr:tRNA (adenosine(37)-N6)-threonylcarbamoyltransferase complex ATPase subunit type 1 TsaE [Leptospira sp.]
MTDATFFEKTFPSITEENMANVADYLKDRINSLRQYCIILLFGEMGSGKTTLIRLTLNRMGVEESVNSPTFAIMNEYHSANTQNSFPNSQELQKHFQKFFHYDFYRLVDPSELEELGTEEVWCKEGHAFIEWADKFPIVYPYPQIQIHFSSDNPLSRNISIRTLEKEDRSKS